MSSAMTSHAPMRAAPSLSAAAETRRDEPREVIETSCGDPIGCSAYTGHPRMGNPRCNHFARDYDDEIWRLATRSRIDAVAGWTRVRRVGGEPGKWSRCGAAFRWIYLPVALYRRLPADPGISLPLERRRLSAPLCLDDSRDALGLRRFHADTRPVLAPGRDDCCAAARALSRIHHVFVARDERRAHAVRDALRRGDAGVGDVGLRDPIAELDANVGMADVRSLRRVLDDHQADQRHHPCRPRVVCRDGAA